MYGAVRTSTYWDAHASLLPQPDSIPIRMRRIFLKFLAAGQKDLRGTIGLSTLAKPLAGSGEVLLLISLHTHAKTFLRFRELVVCIPQHLDQLLWLPFASNQNSIDGTGYKMLADFFEGSLADQDHAPI